MENSEELILIFRILAFVIGAAMVVGGGLALDLSGRDYEEMADRSFLECMMRDLSPFGGFDDLKRFKDNWRNLRGPRTVFLIGLGLLTLGVILVIYG